MFVRLNVVLMPKGVRIYRMASEVPLTYGILVEVVVVDIGSGKSGLVLTGSDVG